MPSRIPRYVIREVLPLYAAGFVVFLLLSTTDLIASIAGALLRYDASILDAVRLYLARLPFIVGQVLPLAVPFAVLIGFGRLAKDSELKALSAGGVRPLNALWPLVPLGLAVSLFAFYNANYLTPTGLARWNAEWTMVWYKTPPRPPGQDLYTFKQGGTLFYAGRVQPDSEAPTRAELSGVLIHTPDVTYSAQSGVWDAERRVWTFSGYWETRPEGQPEYHPETKEVTQTDRLRPPSAPPEQLSLAALRERATDASLDVRDRRAARFELQRRFADPLTALFFAVTAGAMGLLLRNRAWSFAAVVVLIFGFYVVWSAMPQLVKLGALPTVWAAWIPNALLVLTAVILARRLT